jgi:tyrosyl-tRNA synthetase
MTPERQAAILSAGTEEILPEGALLERLRACAAAGRPMRVKQGFDPTAPDIHLGHTVGLRKLRQFQQLGHQVVLIVGDYTGMVGDPSGRSKTRPQLSQNEVEAHARTYLEQFYKVLERDPQPPSLPVEIHRNGEWFSKMSFMDVMKLASEYTVARILERDDFAKRHGAQQPISVHELFYPLMQGYDSVAIRADLELGATEQKFNLLVGRTIQEVHGQTPQVVLTVPVLPGLDGVQRMSKSLGNYIGVTDEPRDMFGKVMSLPDSSMALFWELVTDADVDEVARVKEELASASAHPMEVKKRLARRLVGMYHGADAADRAQHDFEAQFSRREVPENLEEFGRGALAASIDPKREPRILEFIVGAGLAPSKAAARRLVEQGAVSVNGVRVGEPDAAPDATTAFVLRVGRKMKRFNPQAS